MVKEEKQIETKEITTKIRFCDDCGDEMKHIPYSYTSTACEICGKDICKKCVANEEYNGDYIDVYCFNCWDIGKTYRKQISLLENSIEELYEEWHCKCKNKT